MVGMIKKKMSKVRAAAGLYDIVSATVTLKPSGTGTFVGLCPFHDEKTGSFNVRPSLGVWHCFGCGLGGDVFKYVEQSENIDFREAVELLADKYHIELHYENSGNGPARENTGSKRTRLLEACEEAQRFFVSQILTRKHCPPASCLAAATSPKLIANVSAAATRRKAGIISCATWPPRGLRRRKSSTRAWPVKASAASMTISAAE